MPTITTETGVYQRKIYRKGKTARQKTIKCKKNPEKVVLGYLGQAEVYVYPYNFPDKVFIAQFPNKPIVIDTTNLGDLFKTFNLCRWFFNDAFSKPKKRKGANSRRRSVSRGYKVGLDKLKNRKNPSV